MKKPLVSWLIPVYNCEDILPRALNSMLNQTLQDFEIIIVVEYNCSDETCRICEEYKMKDSRIYVFYKKEKSGVGESLNIGLSHCRGKYIARMDSDDVNLPTRLERQVEYMESHPDIGLLGSNCDIIKNGKKEKIKYEKVPDGEEIKATLLFKNCFIHPTIMFRADAANWTYTDEFPFSEDYSLYVKYMSTVEMAILPDVLLECNVYDTGVTLTNFNKSKESGISISRKAIEDELGMSTSEFGDELFGWRDFDEPPENPTEFLCNTLTFLKTIASINKKIKRFDEKSLNEILEQEWNGSKWLLRPYSEIPRLWLSMQEINHRDIIDVFYHLSLFVDKKDSVIFYGAGNQCKKILDQIDQYKPANIIAICDSNPEKQGIIYCNRAVFAPEYLMKSSNDICITSRNHAEEIIEFLTNKYAVNGERIHILDESLPEEIIHYYQKKHEEVR